MAWFILRISYLSAFLECDLYNTNTATRAIVFNGIAVSYQNNEPYSFNWTGLRIDASSVVNYYHRFNQDTNKQQKEFMFLFGLEGSLDESSIFEEDYQIEAMSTVKGLRLINQGQIAGVQTKKITMANISEIDSLQISDNLKTKYRDLVRQGNTLYTPTKQYTYQNWTGLVYISVNPNTGFGGYIIGEGLNGGYTVAQWLANWLYFWKTGLITNAQAIINLPKTVYTLGEKLIYSIFYKFFLSNGQVVEIEEPAEKDTKDLGVGSQPIKPNYDVPGEEKTTEVKQKPILGTHYNQFDDIIIAKGEQYSIPPDLLKSLIHQEAIIDTQQQIFVTNSYRYEAHKDYDWYSGPINDENPSGDRILAHPEHHLTIAGKDTRGRAIPKGNQLPSDYKTIAQTYSFLPLNLTDTNKDGNLTAAELMANNPRQGWPDRADWNFTAQLVLPASYGLGQIMYETAKNRGFDTSQEGQPARDVYDLFKADVSVDLSANYLKEMYDTHGQDWWQALKYYNGGGEKGEKYADSVMKRWTDGTYKLITE